MKLPDWSKMALGIPPEVEAFVHVGGVQYSLGVQLARLLEVLEQGATVSVTCTPGASPRYKMRIASVTGGRYGDGEGETLPVCVAVAVRSMEGM